MFKMSTVGWHAAWSLWS